MRYLTAGDSHGEYLVGIIEGMPAGFRVSIRDIERDLSRRRKAYGRSARQKIEGDSVHVVSGLWRGRTTGAPVAILIQNLGRKVAGKPGGALGTVAILIKQVSAWAHQMKMVSATFRRPIV